jgi:hypothetical protein
MEQKFTLNINKFKKMSNKKKSSVIIVIAEPKTNYNADEPRFLICDDCESISFNTPKTNVFNDYKVDYDRLLF